MTFWIRLFLFKKFNRKEYKIYFNKMSEKKSTQSLKPLIRYDKNFVYKGKKYPIDFILILNNSNYFYERREQFTDIEDIQLTEELIDISEDSIPSFISSLHYESFEINESNVFSLNQLAVKYEVPSLISLTDEFIKKYGTDLIFQSIQYKIQLQKRKPNETTNSIFLEKDEEYIASNLFEYINNEQLLKLPISILYRIINNPKLNINQLNETNKNQMIDFLFKCLNKYGKKASILFLNLDVENQRIEIFSKLTNEYSEIFDFNMINSKFLMKTTTDLLSELSQLKHNYSNSISQVNQLLQEIKNEKQEQQKLIESFKQYSEEQLKKEQEKLNESFQNLKNEIENEKQKQQNLTDSLKQFAEEQLKKENEKLNESFKNLKKQIEDEKQFSQEQIKKEQEKLNESFKNMKIQFENENKNLRSESDKKINEMKLLIDQNNNKMQDFITKNVLNIFF